MMRCPEKIKFYSSFQEIATLIIEMILVTEGFFVYFLIIVIQILF